MANADWASWAAPARRLIGAQELVNALAGLSGLPGASFIKMKRIDAETRTRHQNGGRGR
jgi:hypothetical protein